MENSLPKTIYVLVSDSFLDRDDAIAYCPSVVRVVRTEAARVGAEGTRSASLEHHQRACSPPN